MTLQSLTVVVGSSVDSSYVSNILFELGALSVTVTDADRGKPSEQPIYGEPPQDGLLSPTPQNSLWRNSKITSLYPLSQDMEALQMHIATYFDLPTIPTLSLHSELFDEKDPDYWVRHVQESFTPITIGRIRISFPWHDPTPDMLNVRLEPGSGFGTGEHATTQLCATWLQAAIRPNMSVLDFGTGSGILAIVAVTLEQSVTAVAIDIDPTVLPIASENAARNKVENRISFFINAEEPKREPYDIVVANILAGPLKCLSQLLASRVKVGGRIGLSGVLASQAPDLIECYQQHGFILEESMVKDGWALLVGVKT